MFFGKKWFIKKSGAKFVKKCVLPRRLKQLICLVNWSSSKQHSCDAHLETDSIGLPLTVHGTCTGDETTQVPSIIAKK